LTQIIIYLNSYSAANLYVYEPTRAARKVVWKDSQRQNCW